MQWSKHLVSMCRTPTTIPETCGKAKHCHAKFVSSVFVSSESLEALWIDLHCLWFMLIFMMFYCVIFCLLYLFLLIVWTRPIFLWRRSYKETLKDKQYVWLVELTTALSVLSGFRLLQDVGSCVQWVKRPLSQFVGAHKSKPIWDNLISQLESIQSDWQKKKKWGHKHTFLYAPW